MNYLQVLRAELSDLQEHHAMRRQEKARSPEMGPDLHRVLSLLPGRISRAEVAVSIAERTGKESAISGAQAAIIDAWRVTGTLA